MAPSSVLLVVIGTLPLAHRRALCAAALPVTLLPTVATGLAWVRARLQHAPVPPLIIVLAPTIPVAAPETPDCLAGWQVAAALRQAMLIGELAPAWLVCALDPAMSTDMPRQIGGRLWPLDEDPATHIQELSTLGASGPPRLTLPVQHLLRPSSATEHMLMDLLEEQYVTFLGAVRAQVEQLQAVHARLTTPATYTASEVQLMLRLITPSLHLRQADHAAAQAVLQSVGGPMAFRHWLRSQLPLLPAPLPTFVQLLLDGHDQRAIGRTLALGRRGRLRLIARVCDLLAPVLHPCSAPLQDGA